MKEPGLHFKDAQGRWRSFRQIHGYLRAIPKKRHCVRTDTESELDMFKQIFRDTMMFQSRHARDIAGGIVFWVCLIAMVACLTKVYLLWQSLNALQP